MGDLEEMARKVVVRGIKTFKEVKEEWPHPIAVIGAGYNGLKTGLWWQKNNDSNFAIFDRNDRVGGYCWITAANKHSKLQTEFAAFHVWYGPPFGDDPRCGGMPDLKSWEVWPQKEKVLEHMQRAAEEYGVLPHCHFSVNVAAMEVQGAKTDNNRTYNLIVNPLKVSDPSPYEFKASGIISFPGSMTGNRIVEYPGEDVFDGHIGYAMNDDIPYDHIPESNTAILGNGAFAVENVRTCCQYNVNKVFLVTRRKNLPCPRLPCWFVHQVSIPCSARLLLNIMAPMYAATGFEDPWSYHSVYGKKDGKGTVTISQSSRFGIGDVTFLAHAYGKLEYVVDTLKRLTRHTLHLHSGKKLEKVNVILKALGLIGDYQVDKLHKMKKLLGTWCDGDWKRPIGLDAVGMHAANFETMSTGIGSYHQVVEHKFFFDFPKEMYKLEAMGLRDMLPTRKSDEWRPCYLFDVKYAMSAGMTLGTMCPKLGVVKGDIGQYKHRSMLHHTPIDKYLELAIEEWDKYQRDWQAKGWDREYVPYPYSKKDVKQWAQIHSVHVGGLAYDDSGIQLVQRAVDSGMQKPIQREYVDDPGYNEGCYWWWSASSPQAANIMTHARQKSAPPRLR